MPFSLGLVCHGWHESAAVLIDDGHVVAAAEEERFTRRKFDNSFPLHAIEFCLRHAGISCGDLAAIGFGFDPRRRLLAKAGYLARHFPQSLNLLATRSGLLRQMNSVEQTIRSRLGYLGPVHRLNHHLCHAASTFYASPFSEAAILTIDGAGDWEATWWGGGRGTHIGQRGAVDWPCSLGHLYAAFTEYLGFQAFSDEYRVMGLAPYGTPKFAAEMAQIFRPKPRGYGVDLDYFAFPTGHSPRFGRKLVEKFGPPLRGTEDEIPEHYQDIAASLQGQLEVVYLHLAQLAIREFGVRRLCLAGGVAMNCVANGRLRAAGVADDLYVPPCASDAGAALGAAYLAHLRTAGCLNREPLTSALLGPAFDDDEIARALAAAGIVAERIADPAACAARLLSEGRVIGWFQGRMEFGQRALGARSILADPRRAEMKEIINAKVKFREPFRPFAPSVLEERAAEFFEGAHRTPFMTETYRVKEDKRSAIPAVTHVDGTARVQTVSREDGALYWQLIKYFGDATGVPVVLDTSFNVKGQPIVNTPAEAAQTFLATDLDALVCGNFLAVKTSSP